MIARLIDSCLQFARTVAISRSSRCSSVRFWFSDGFKAIVPCAPIVSAIRSTE